MARFAEFLIASFWFVESGALQAVAFGLARPRISGTPMTAILDQFLHEHGYAFTVNARRQ